MFSGYEESAIDLTKLHTQLLSSIQLNQIIHKIRRMNPRIPCTHLVHLLLNETDAQNKSVIEKIIIRNNIIKVTDKMIDGNKTRYDTYKILYKFIPYKINLYFDIDGTSIEQRIDKHIFYNLMHAPATMKFFAFQIMFLLTRQLNPQEKIAISFLTARPESIENILQMMEPSAGTLATSTIQKKINHHLGIAQDIPVLRVAIGLKGNILSTEQKKLGDNDVCILFEDQLRQINDVHNQHNDHIIALDINNAKDRQLVCSLLNISQEFSIYPYQQIQNAIHTYFCETFQHNDSHGVESLGTLHQTLNQDYLLLSQYQRLILNDIFDDLLLMFDEAYRCSPQYKPRMSNALNTANALNILLQKIKSNQLVTKDDIESAVVAVFGNKAKLKLMIQEVYHLLFNISDHHINLNACNPTTKCEKNITALLLDLARNQLFRHHIS